MADMELMTMKEVAKKLKMSEAMIYKLIKTGQLKSYSFGIDRHVTNKRKVGAIRISQQQLDEFLAVSEEERISFDLRDSIKPVSKTKLTPKVGTMTNALNKALSRKKLAKKRRKTT